ncbi:zinc finger BED domain-containing protein RICESLEEPER 1-like [Arachis stenosperma]|uniref:zinc finger BED domain-containing protein RICESLEEPER 1-like n=1 Tax=Arachis stenosperma TaxID=217475 RepID=UPI0025AD233A|nr:zinc finger BED domain-containing protein RICESLEEPER 1-like [Arachis stenosperma]
MSLTAHFVDEEWKLQKRIINFCQIENHKGDTVGREIEKYLREWGIEKVFTITVDNATSNDGAITYLQRKLGARGGLVCGGKYMHVRCCAHVLNLIVNEGIKEQQTSIESIRNAVRWFEEDSGGKKKVGPPTALDWQHARLFIEFLRIFYEITLSFSSSLHVTSNKCFHEIASIASQLTSWSQSHSELLGSMACSMKTKYHKYWGPVDKFNPLLLVAVVLDPRYKLDYLCWCLEDVYDKEVSTNMTGFVKLTLETLYKFYEKEVVDDKGREDGGSSSRDVLDDNTKVSTGAKGVSENRVNMWKKQKREKANADSKSDVERYLAEDTVEDENFDILAWWKVNASKYRVLSLLARDVLGIPVSTVASESCFSTGGRVLDVFRSSLSPLMAEALICTQSWLCPSKQEVGDQEFDQFDSSQKIVEARSTVMDDDIIDLGLDVDALPPEDDDLQEEDGIDGDEEEKNVFDDSQKTTSKKMDGELEKEDDESD